MKISSGTVSEFYAKLRVTQFLSKNKNVVPNLGEQSTNSKAIIFNCNQIDTNQFSFGFLSKPKREKEITKKLEQITEAVKITQARWQNTKADKLATQLSSLLKERKNYLIELIYRNPEEAMKLIISDNSLKDNTKNCIEHYVKLEGQFFIQHNDQLEIEYTQDLYYLKTDTRTYSIHPAYVAKNDNLIPGTSIKISGYQIDNEILFDAKSPFGTVAGGIDLVEKAIKGPVDIQKILMFPANFQDTNQTDINYFSLQPIAKDITHYYLENSYGKMTMTFDVKNWVSLDINQSCDVKLILEKAIEAIDPSVDFNKDYQQVVVVAPIDCAFSGTIRNPMTYQTDEGERSIPSVLVSAHHTTFKVYAHELGHNLGIAHAAFYSCTTENLSVVDGEDNGCKVEEYGDLYDVMGSGTGHFTVPHKLKAGWLDESLKLQEIQTDGIYAIAPIETSTSGIKGLMIPRKTKNNDNNEEYPDPLYIEYRRPILFDDYLASLESIEERNLTNGAVIHIQNEYGPKYSLLIDPTQPPISKFTVALPVGASFYDRYSGATLAPIELNDSEIKIKITFKKKADFNPPTNVAITSPQNGTSASNTISLFASAVDVETGVQKVEYYMTNAQGKDELIGSDTETPYTISFNTRTLANGSYPFWIVAYDESVKDFNDLEANSTTSEKIILNIKNVNENPKIALNSPVDGAIISGKILIQSVATDDTEISRVEFYKDLDVEPFASINTSPYETELDTTMLFNGQHQIQVWAWDNLNKYAYDEITIMVQN